MEKLRSHKNLNEYQIAYKAALRIHQLTKTFPSEEKYALTDQIRRSSRPVCANLAEAWRKNATQKISFQSYQIQKLKQLKIKHCYAYQYEPTSQKPDNKTK